MAYTFADKTDGVDDVLAADINAVQNALEAHKFITAKAATQLTIASGVLTVVQACHKIQPQSGTADDLDTISGMDAGDILILYIADAGTDTITVKHRTGNISCSGGSDINFSEGALICYFDGTTVYVSGGGGTTIKEQSISPTTSSFSAVSNYRYYADISGMTASRNFTLPAPGAKGKTIELLIVSGNETYDFIIIGASTVTINGGSANTSWSKLFITNEYIKLVSTSATNWNVVVDKRIPCKCSIKNAAEQTITTNSSNLVVLDTVTFDVGALNRVANNKIIIRRTGYYNIFAALQYRAMTASRVMTNIVKNGTNIARVEMTASTTYPAMSPNIFTYLEHGDSINLTTYHNASGDINTSVANVPPYLAVCEVLP